MLSRWGMNSNVFPVLVLFAFALALRGLERPRWLVPAFIVLALGLYAYGTAYVFVPLFAIGIFAYGWRRRVVDFRHWVVASAAMALVALPIGLFLMVNLFELPAIELPLLSMPRLTGETRLVTESVFFAADPFGDLLRNAKAVFDILVAEGWRAGSETGWRTFIHNALPECGQHYRGMWIHNRLPGFGYFYHWLGLCITLAGACFMARDLVSGRRPRNLLVAMWLGAAIVTATLTQPHMQRLGPVFFPLLLCAAYGLSGAAASGVRWVDRTASVLRVVAVAYLVFSFAAFARHYLTEYSRTPFFPPSYAQALAHVIAHAEPDDAIYVPADAQTLFYDPLAPRLYMNTVRIEDMDVKFQKTLSFGRYRIGIDAEAAEHGDAFVVWAEDPTDGSWRGWCGRASDDAPMFPTSTFDVTRFGYFNAVIRR